MMPVTVAICTYNRADMLPRLAAALRGQDCDLPFEILFVDNNSADATPEVLSRLASEPGAPLRFVRETQQGIVPARNRAIRECTGSEFMIVMDDDELPRPGWVQAAVTGLRDDGADCVGGRVEVDFSLQPRPSWLGDELLGFLAAIDYGDQPFWIESADTPIWTANVAYRTSIFRDGLKFDARYTRTGGAVGGGSDLKMFETLLERGVRMRYRPDMVIDHHVEAWRLKRSYFLKLHYTSGYKHGLHELATDGRSLLGIPLYLFPQAVRAWMKACRMGLTFQPGALRQTMNAMHCLGMMSGTFARWHAPH